MTSAPKYAYSAARLGGVTLAEAARVLGREPIMVSSRGYVTSLSYLSPAPAGVTVDYTVNVGVYGSKVDAHGYKVPDWNEHPLNGQVFATREAAQEAKFTAGVTSLYLTTYEAAAIAARAVKTGA